MDTQARTVLTKLVPFFVGTLIGLITLYSGMTYLAGMDEGVFSKIAYQLYLGHHPYQDIITLVPPLFMGVLYVAVRWFGPFYYACVLLNALLATGSFGLAYYFLRKSSVSRTLSCFISSSLVLSTLSVVGFLWYNQISYLVIFLFGLSLLRCFHTQAPKHFLDFFIAVLTGLLFFIKINMAVTILALLIILLLYLFFGGYHNHFKKILYSVLLGTALAVAIMLAYAPIFASYFTLLKTFVYHSRNYILVYLFKHFSLFDALILGIISIYFLLVGYTWYRRPFKVGQPFIFSLPFLFSLAFVGLGIVSLLTNNDSKLCELGFFYMACCLLMLCPESGPISQKKNWLIVFLSGLILGTSIVGIVINIRSLQVGFYQKEYPKLGYKPFTTSGYFSYFVSGPKLPRLLQDIDHLLRIHHIPTGHPIYFGARIDFSYAVFHIVPPKGLPIWWEGFDSPRFIRAYQRAQFDTIITLKDDVTFLPQVIVDDLHAHYSVFTQGDASLYVRHRMP